MGIKERREREKLQRRSDILDAAEKVFFGKGFYAATMDDVATEAELSKGTLYLYFKNKGELYFSLTYRALQNLAIRFHKVLNGKGSGLDKVLEIGQAFFKFSHEEPDYYKTIAQFELAQLDTSPEGQEVMNKCHESGREVMQYVAKAIESGIEDGTIRKDIDPMRTAFLLQGLSNGIIQLVMREGEHLHKYEGFDANDMLNDFIAMMIRSLQPD